MTSKNSEGFYLVEAVIAISLLFFLSASLFGAWQLLAELKVERTLDSLALDLIQNEAEAFFAHWGWEGSSSHHVDLEGYRFSVTRSIEDGERWQRGKVEIRWLLPAGKEKRIEIVMYRLKGDLPSQN